MELKFLFMKFPSIKRFEKTMENCKSESESFTKTENKVRSVNFSENLQSINHI